REVHRLSVPPKGPATAQKRVEAGLGDKSGAFTMIWNNEYLRAIAAFSVLFTFVNTNGEDMPGRLVKEAADAAVHLGTLAESAKEQYISEQYSDFYLYTNIASMTLQAFVVSRLIRRFGMRVAFLVLPIVPIIDALGVAVMPLLGLLF